MIKNGVIHLGVSFDVRLTPICQIELMVSSPCLSMIPDSAGERRGNYLHIRVNKRRDVGITMSLPLITAPTSCVQSQLAKCDLAISEH